MGFVNAKADKNKLKKGEHRNWMGGICRDIRDPLLRLRVAASTCFFGEPMYYHSDSGDKRRGPKRGAGRPSLSSPQYDRLKETLGELDPEFQEWRNKTPAQMIEHAIDQALDADPKATLEEAVRLRKEEHMRLTPQVILVRAAHHPKVRGTRLLLQHGLPALFRVDDAINGLAYQLASFGRKAIPNSLKKVWRKFLEGRKAYHLAKYRMEGREVKLVDLITLCHAHSEPIAKLMEGNLKNEKTWETIVSAGGSNSDSWAKAVPQMSHMALLRNLRNLSQKASKEVLDQALSRLLESADGGMQFPFRYLAAHRELKDVPGRVRDAVEECLERSVGRLPRFSGRLMALADNSGSTHGTGVSKYSKMRVCDIANLTSVLCARCADEGEIGVFGDGLKIVQSRRKASIMDQAEKLEQIGRGIGGGTENGIWIFFRDALRKKTKYDTIFVFSDQQAGHGGLYGIDPSEYAEYGWSGRRDTHIDVAKLVWRYRQDVNPDVDVYLVQVAGYQDVLIPEWYKRTYILGGWGEGLLRFAAEMKQVVGQNQQ